MHLRMHHEFHVPAWMHRLLHVALIAAVALLAFALPRALANQAFPHADTELAQSQAVAHQAHGRAG